MMWQYAVMVLLAAWYVGVSFGSVVTEIPFGDFGEISVWACEFSDVVASSTIPARILYFVVKFALFVHGGDAEAVQGNSGEGGVVRSWISSVIEAYFTISLIDSVYSMGWSRWSDLAARVCGMMLGIFVLVYLILPKFYVRRRRGMRRDVITPGEFKVLCDFDAVMDKVMYVVALVISWESYRMRGIMYAVASAQKVFNIYRAIKAVLICFAFPTIVAIASSIIYFRGEAEVERVSWFGVVCWAREQNAAGCRVLQPQLNN